MISYCPHCGEYLGDYVNGVLFKFGQRVTEPHLCPRQSCVDGEGTLSRDYLDEIDRLVLPNTSLRLIITEEVR